MAGMLEEPLHGGNDDGTCLSAEEAPVTKDEGSLALQAPTPRTCVVCFERPIDTAAIPCRHSILCSECMDHVRRDTGLCPACRHHIDYVIRGAFEAEFVNVPGLLVLKASNRLGQVSDIAYSGMYSHVRGFMLVGSLCAAGSLACICTPLTVPFAGPLAGAALLVGYVPWFLTTVEAFEAPEQPDGQGRRSVFLRNEDEGSLSYGIRLAALTVVAPVSLAVFFLPYAGYAIGWRLVIKRGVPFVIEELVLQPLVCVSLRSYTYILRPLGTCLTHCARVSSRAVRWLVGRTMFAVLSIARGVGNGAQVIGRGVAFVAEHVWHALRAAARVIRQTALSTWDCGAGCAQSLAENVFLPLFRGLRQLCITLASRSSQAAHALFTHVIQPLNLAIHDWVLAPTGRGVTCLANACATGVCRLASGLHQLVQAAGEGLARLAEGFYARVLRPLGSATYSGARCVLVSTIEGAGFMARMTYTYVLAPGASLSCRLLSLTAQGLARGSELAYSYVLSPIGRGMWFLASKTGHSLAAIARAGFEYVVLPSGRALVWLARGMGYAAAAGASAFYSHILVPIRSAAGAVAGALGRGARAFGGAVASVARVVARALRAAAEALGQFGAAAASATYTWLLLPLGSALGRAAGAARAAAQGVWLLATQTSSAIYVSVLVPVGVAIRNIGIAINQDVVQPVRAVLRSARTGIAGAARAAAESGRQAAEQVKTVMRQARTDLRNAFRR